MKIVLILSGYSARADAAAKNQQRLILRQVADGVTGPAARRSARLPDLDEVDANNLPIDEGRLQVAQLTLELTGRVLAAEHVNSVLNCVGQSRDFVSTLLVVDDRDALGLCKRLVVLLVIDARPGEVLQVQVEHFSGEGACLEHTAIDDHGFF